jgi:hypothetical protein
LDWKTAGGKSKISSMEESFTTLFEPSPRKPAELPDDKKGRKPFKVSILFLPIYLPLFFMAAAISIPWTHVYRLRQRRKERRFAEQMKAAGRLMTWLEFKRVIGNGEGTAIGEYLSTKGPFRLWWTPEDIPANSPYRCDREKHLAWLEQEFLPFFTWCYERFTQPQSGLARLVSVPEEERKELPKTLASVRFVSICSFRSLREKRLKTRLR